MMYSKVYVEITNVCNKNCSFCPGTKRKPEYMSLEKFNSVLRKLQGFTEYIYFHVMGEPLLHPQIEEFIRLAKDMDFKPCITTNGSLLSSMGEKIVKAGVHKVNISVHSFENGEKEDYLNYINSCLDFADYSSKSGVLSILRLWNNGCDDGLNASTLGLIKERFPDDWHFGKRGARIRNKLHLEYGERFSWPDISLDTVGESVFCYGLKDHFGILCDGTVIPCCLDREGDINLGNIFEDSLENILSSKKATAIRTGFTCRKAVEELCQKCGYATRF